MTPAVSCCWITKVESTFQRLTRYHGGNHDRIDRRHRVHVRDVQPTWGGGSRTPSLRPPSTAAAGGPALRHLRDDRGSESLLALYTLPGHRDAARHVLAVDHA